MKIIEVKKIICLFEKPVPNVVADFLMAKNLSNENKI